VNQDKGITGWDCPELVFLEIGSPLLDLLRFFVNWSNLGNKMERSPPWVQVELKSYINDTPTA
jgi:hypothetical protein